MTEQIQIDFTTNRTLRTLSVPAYKFNLHYGKELVAKGKTLKVLKAKVFPNDKGCFLIGIFPEMSQFNFGEWDKDAPSDSKYNNNKGAFVVNPDLAPKPDDVICLFLPKSDKLEGYSGFEGLAKFLSNSLFGGKIENSYLTLNLPDYSSFAVNPENGNPVDSGTAEVLISIGKRHNRFSISPSESGTDFTSIDAVEIPDSFGETAKGYGSGSKVEIHQETVEERMQARLKILENQETRKKICEVYFAIREEYLQYEELLLGELTFDDFLEMILR